MFEAEPQEAETRRHAIERRRRIVAKSIFAVVAMVAGSLAFLFSADVLGLPGVVSGLVSGVVVLAIAAVIRGGDDWR